jgi:myo-inositol-1-phosphate synthase
MPLEKKVIAETIVGLSFAEINQCESNLVATPPADGVVVQKLEKLRGKGTKLPSMMEKV